MKTQFVGRNYFRHTQIVSSKVFLLIAFSPAFLKKILGNSLMKTQFMGQNNHNIINKLCDLNSLRLKQYFFKNY